MSRRLFSAFSALLCVLCACTTEHAFHDVDRPVPPPSEMQLEAWKGDAYRRDPCQVAHYEIQAYLDVPWRGQRFDPAKYEFHERNPERPEWGSYVVRGFNDRSGRTTRYRVKVRRVGDVWVALEVSHYILVTMPHPALEDDDGPPRTR